MSMTKEQKEAIEILEGMVKSYIEADECGLSNNDFKHEIKAMQTVLNILKDKDREIEKKDKQIDLMSEHIANSAIIVCEDGEILIEEEFLLSLIANNIEIF